MGQAVPADGGLDVENWSFLDYFLPSAFSGSRDNQASARRLREIAAQL